MIGPVFEKLSEKYDKVTFAKIDVDEVSSVAEDCGVCLNHNIRLLVKFAFLIN